MSRPLLFAFAALLFAAPAALAQQTDAPAPEAAPDSTHEATPPAQQGAPQHYRPATNRVRRYGQRAARGRLRARNLRNQPAAPRIGPDGRVLPRGQSYTDAIREVNRRARLERIETRRHNHADEQRREDG